MSSTVGGTGPVDATFFEDAQGPYAATVFHSWLMVVRGELRRTGRRGVSLRATGCWELPQLHAAWDQAGEGAAGLLAARELMAQVPLGFGGLETGGDLGAVQGAAESRASRPVTARPSVGDRSPGAAGGMGRRRVLVHSSGFRMSPYADIKPAGEDAKNLPRSQTKSPQPGRPTPAPRKLWHSSPGSSGG